MVPISGEVPDGLRVEHAVRLVVGELTVQRLAPGEASATGHLDVVKAVDRSTGRPVELGFDERGRRVDPRKRLAQLAARRAERYGRIHETLFERIENARDTTRVPIVVWPRIELPAAPYDKPTERHSEEPPEGEKVVAEQLPRHHRGAARHPAAGQGGAHR